MPSPLANLLFAPDVNGTVTYRPNDKAWVRLAVDVVGRDGHAGLREPAALLRCLAESCHLPAADPRGVAAVLSAPQVPIESAVNALSRPGWSGEALRVVMSEVVTTRGVLGFYGLTLQTLPHAYRDSLYQLLRSTRRAQLKVYLGSLTTIDAWLADTAIDLVPGQSLGRWVRVATDADAIARRLLSFPEPPLGLIRAAAECHRFSPGYSRRLAARVRRAPAGVVRDQVLVLLGSPTTDPVEVVAADLRGPRAGTGRRDPYERVLTLVADGTIPPWDLSTMAEFFVRAASIVGAAQTTPVRDAWLTTLPLDDILALPSRPGRPSLGEPEIARRARTGDVGCLTHLCATSSTRIRDEPDLQQLARTLVPITQMLKSSAVSSTLISPELTRLHDRAGIEAADVFARLFPTFTGTISELAELAVEIANQPGSATPSASALAAGAPADTSVC